MEWSRATGWEWMPAFKIQFFKTLSLTKIKKERKFKKTFKTINNQVNFKTKGYKPRGILRFMKDNCKAVSHKTLSKLSTTPLSNWYLPNEHPKIPILIKTIFIIRLALTKPCF